MSTSLFPVAPLAKKALGLLLVAGVAIPAAAHAAHERQEQVRAAREMESLAGMVSQVSIPAGGEQRVTINGAPMIFKKHTEQGTLSEVMGRIAKQCESGTEAAAFGLTKATDDGNSKPIKLERVVSQGEGDVQASLCVFANEHEGATAREEMRRVRYTLAFKREDGSIGVTTVVNASSTPLQEMFPAEGDAPGSDLAGVARPEASRRTLTATLGTGEGAHVIRVYESTLDLPVALASYDRAMGGMGFETTGSLEDARMYRKDGKSYAASFRATTGGSTIALIPFHP